MSFFLPTLAGYDAWETRRALALRADELIREVLAAPSAYDRRKSRRALSRESRYIAVRLQQLEDAPKASLETSSVSFSAILQRTPTWCHFALENESHAWQRPILLGAYSGGLGHLREAVATPPNAQANYLSLSLTAAFSALDLLVEALSTIAHAVVTVVGRPKKTLLANCISRRRCALMRFIVGFFGSRKVDARNTP